jgi:GMP synthase-like glutamine amidotransferase
MADPVCIFRHSADQGPGYLLEVLERAAIPYQVINADRDESLSMPLESVGGLVFMGGSFDVHDEAQWIGRELDLVRAAAQAGIPLLGHNQGAELITWALGGMVVRSRVKRIGWFPVQRQHNPAAEQWLDDVPEDVEVFHWHEHAFSLPPGATPLLKSQWCLNEAYLCGKALAIQGHFEMTEELIRKRIAAGTGQDISPPDNLTLNWDAIIQSGEKICADLPQKIAALHRAADRLYERWLQFVTAA